MISVADIEFYIMDNVLHSESWDELDPIKKEKAVKNAMTTLTEYLSEYHEVPVPMFDLVEQVLFIIRKDENMMKAEMGLKGMGVDGISMSYDKISPIAPSLMVKYGITLDSIQSGVKRKRKVGRYVVTQHDTFRTWG